MRRRTFCALAGTAALWAALSGTAPGLTAFAWAEHTKNPAPADDPTALQSELDHLRVMYKDNHPDVIRAKRALERALERVRERARLEDKAEQADAQKR